MVREAFARSQKPGVFQMDVQIGAHKLTSDVPPDLGGEDRGPGPEEELLAAALAACTSITVTMYAKRKQWPLERIAVSVRQEKLEKPPEGTPVDRFVREISLEGNLDAEQRARLLDVANKCPVHKTLTAGSRIETRAVERVG